MVLLCFHCNAQSNTNIFLLKNRRKCTTKYFNVSLRMLHIMLPPLSTLPYLPCFKEEKCNLLSLDTVFLVRHHEWLLSPFRDVSHILKTSSNKNILCSQESTHKIKVLARLPWLISAITYSVCLKWSWYFIFVNTLLKLPDEC